MNDTPAWVPTDEERLRTEAKHAMGWFGGATHCWSGYDPSKVYWDEKEQKLKIDKAIKPPARTELTVDQWMTHRMGGWSLGIYLIDEKNECIAGCIDIDKGENTDPTVWAKIVAEAELPLTVFESRSGKAHLYLFLMEPVPARLLRRALTKFVTLLGLPPTTEIFPKQDTVDWDTATGSWINAPFYGDERWPIGPDGQRLPLTPCPPHWQSAKAIKEFVGPEEKPSGGKKRKKTASKKKGKNDDDDNAFNVDDAERWLEYHAEKVANAVAGTGNEALRDAIWAMCHMAPDYIDEDDIDDALRGVWEERKKDQPGDAEFDEMWKRTWRKVTKDDDPPPRWPEYVIVRNFGGRQPKLIKWLGRGWTAIGQIALWSGDSDVGKTTTLIDYTARLTTGGTLPFTNERLPVKRVLMAIAEDDEDDTIIPRLIRAGANMNLFDQLVGYKKRDGTEGEICIDTEAGRKRIDEALSKHPGEYGLLVFDPDTAFLSARFATNDVIAWRSQVMKPMKKLARRHGVAVLFIAHPRKVKQGELALHSVSGNAAQVQASRIHCVFGDEFSKVIDPETGNEKKERTGNFLMAFGRAANLPRSEKRKTRVGRVVGGNVMIEGEETSVGGIEWLGLREDVTADDVVSNRGGIGEEQSGGGSSSGWSGGRKKNEARAWLRSVLKGGPMLSSEVTRIAVEEQGIGKTTLDRTKTQMADCGELFYVRNPSDPAHGAVWLSLKKEVQWEFVMNPPF